MPQAHTAISSEAMGSCIAQQSVATGVVNIDEVDLEGRFLRLKELFRQGPVFGGTGGFKGQVLEGEDMAYKFTQSCGVARQGGQLAQGLRRVPMNPCVEEPG